MDENQESLPVYTELQTSTTDDPRYAVYWFALHINSFLSCTPTHYGCLSTSTPLSITRQDHYCGQNCVYSALDGTGEDMLPWQPHVEGSMSE